VVKAGNFGEAPGTRRLALDPGRGVRDFLELHGIEPFDYLRDVLDKLGGGWPMRRLDELMPDRWAAEHTRVCARLLGG